jgi:hypothetical protein
MKVYIESLGVNELTRLLRRLALRADPRIHTLADDASQADLILLCGNWTSPGEGSRITRHPLIRRYPDRCAVYCDDDLYLPLMPGVYCSPKGGYSTRKGRVRAYSYIARHVAKGNPYVEKLPADRVRDLLFSFQGSSTAFVRKRLFKTNFARSDVLIEDTTHHTNWVRTVNSEEQQQRYVETAGRSHFVLCPRGSGSGSFRLFEVMRTGTAPVLLSDSYVLPEGPHWDSFLIQVKESEIGTLPSILETYRDQSAIRGERAADAWQRWFSTEQEFNQIVERAQAALVSASSGEALYRFFWPLMIAVSRTRVVLRRVARTTALWILRTLKLRPPFRVRDHSIPEFDPKGDNDDL